jgi:hypothetical protein
MLSRSELLFFFAILYSPLDIRCLNDISICASIRSSAEGRNRLRQREMRAKGPVAKMIVKSFSPIGKSL